MIYKKFLKCKNHQKKVPTGSGWYALVVLKILASQKDNLQGSFIIIRNLTYIWPIRCNHPSGTDSIEGHMFKALSLEASNVLWPRHGGGCGYMIEWWSVQNCAKNAGKASSNTRSKEQLGPTAQSGGGVYPIYVLIWKASYDEATKKRTAAKLLLLVQRVGYRS